jgi:hypothetical protein
LKSLSQKYLAKPRRVSGNLNSNCIARNASLGREPELEELVHFAESLTAKGWNIGETAQQVVADELQVGNLYEGKVIVDSSYGHVAYGCAQPNGETLDWEGG